MVHLGKAHLVSNLKKKKKNIMEHVAKLNIDIMLKKCLLKAITKPFLQKRTPESSRKECLILGGAWSKENQPILI